MSPRAINGTAKRDTRCAACRSEIKAGDRVHMRRERALSYAHACAAGTAYPWRIECCTCAVAWNAVHASVPVSAVGGAR